MENKLILQGESERKKGVHFEVDTSLEPLGEGGSGIVRKGIMVDEKTGSRTEVAIKFLFDDLVDEVVERSIREASINIDSDNLIKMIGFIETDDKDVLGLPVKHYHVVSELLHGVMLSDIVEGKVDRNNVPPAVLDYINLYDNDREEFAKKVIRQVLSAVQTLHDRSYIHRDIDPTNIMITDKGNLKLIDFGISKKISDIKKVKGLTTEGKFIGKADYAAPELALGDLNGQNKTTDIYAVGVLLYQILTGSLPFSGTMYEVLQKQIHDKIPVKNIKDSQWREIVRKATSKKQIDRYQSAAEFRVAIDSIKKVNPFPWKRLALIAASVVVLICLGFGVVKLVNNMNNTSTTAETTSGNGNAVNGEGPGNGGGTTSDTAPDPIATDTTKATIDGSGGNKPGDEPTNAGKTDDDETKGSKDDGGTKGGKNGGDDDETIINPPKSDSKSSGTLSLSYGTYTGAIKNGQPNGKGKLVFTSTHRISKYDPNGDVAQPGEYVDGIFSNGELTFGKYYSASGELIKRYTLGSE